MTVGGVTSLFRGLFTCQAEVDASTGTEQLFPAEGTLVESRHPILHSVRKKVQIK